MAINVDRIANNWYELQIYERGFQDIDFSRFTIMLQDLKHSKTCFCKMYQDSKKGSSEMYWDSKIHPKLSKTLKHIQVFSNIFQIYLDLLDFKIIQHVSRSRRFCFDSTMLVFRVFSKRSLTPIVPPTFELYLLAHTISKVSKHWPSGFSTRALFQSGF